MTRAPWSPVPTGTVRRLHGEGLNDAQIAAALDRRASTISRTRKALGLPANASRGGQVKYRAELDAQLQAKGRGAHEIAAHLGMTVGSLRTTRCRIRREAGAP